MREVPERIGRLPEQYFTALLARVAAAAAAGGEPLVDLGRGNPEVRPPPHRAAARAPPAAARRRRARRIGSAPRRARVRAVLRPARAEGGDRRSLRRGLRRAA